jgi:Cu/Ag efflux protein CusF
MKSTFFALIAATVLLTTAADTGAQGAPAQSDKPASSIVAVSDTAWSVAEIRKIDADAGKLTLKHGPIKNLDMPGMTMVFQVKAGIALDKFKVGDKLNFRATSEGGKYWVSEIETQK